MRLMLCAATSLLLAAHAAAQIPIVQSLNAAGVTAVDASGKRTTAHFTPQQNFPYESFITKRHVKSTSPAFELEAEVHGPRLVEGEVAMGFRVYGRAANGTSIRSLTTSKDSRGTAGACSYEVSFDLPVGRSCRVYTTNIFGIPGRATINGNPLGTGSLYLAKPGRYVIRVDLVGSVQTKASGSGDSTLGIWYRINLQLGGSYREYGTRCGPTTLDGAGVLLPRQFFTLTLDKIPSGAPAVLMASDSRSRFGSFRLPLPLDGLGAQGCTLLVGSESLHYLPLRQFGGQASFVFGVPVQQLWPIYVQGLVLDPRANALGVTLTEAAQLLFN